MNCPAARNCLIDYIENGLDAFQQHEIGIHLEECPECREFECKLQEALKFYATEKDTEFDPFMLTRIQSIIEKSQQNQYSVVKHRILQPILAAVLVLMIAFTGISLGKSYSFKNTLVNDYETELYYLSAIHGENLESLILIK